jgi:aspartate aminotransferase
MTGWRLGYCVLPTSEEAALFKNLNIHTVSCTPAFIQEAGRVALENEAEMSTIIAGMVSEFQRRRDRIVSALERIPGMRCVSPEGAFYVFPSIAGVCEHLGIIEAHKALPAEARGRTSPSTMFQMFALYRHGVATLDRRGFCTLGSEGQHYLRLSIAAGQEQLDEGVKRLTAASQDVAGFQEFLQQGGPLY